MRNLISGIVGLVIGGLILIGDIISVFMIPDWSRWIPQAIAAFFGVLLVLAGLGYIVWGLFTIDWSGSGDSEEFTPRKKKKRRVVVEEDED